MNRISRKLRSQKGVSMIIALLFLMICLFVGGTVLAAATANGSRAARMSHQQELLSQRSAANLIAEEIDGGKVVSSLTLTVEDLVLDYQPLKQTAGGWENDGSGAASQERIIAFRAPFTAENTMTGLQRILYETAVCRYLMECGVIVDGTAVRVELENFWYEGGRITSLSAFWYPYCPGETRIGGTMAISGRLDATGEVFTDDTACFTSGAQENIYDFIVSFDNSRMTVSADACMSTTRIPRPVERMAQETGGFVEITITETRTYITWEWAYIRKGDGTQ